MECQECQKRPATLHLGQVINGQKTEVHVCEVCAKEKGYMMYPDDGYSIQDLLSSLFSFDSSKMGAANDTTFSKKPELQCPKCELTFSEFKRIGKFGCAECYHTFSEKLDPIIRRVHSGNIKHHGKIPKRKGGNLHVKKQLESYKSELQRLIEKEAFEEAAEVRDNIKDLELQIRNKEAGDDK